MSIQDYEILSKLGSGSFGVVHKARDKKTNTIVVIKVVDISSMNAKLRKSAMDEGRILKQMNSPYIVKHFSTFIHKSTLNIVMQYCPKGDLTNYMKAQMGKPFKEESIWKISIQMMVGLRDLHAKKILHRDIKTLNVFLDDQYNVRIGDLGVAKSMTADFAHTIVGTPYYLSPQMCEEKPYNQKTDIWAMGCIIYELCTGKRPFQANNQAALALKIVMGKYENIPSHYSSDLNWVVKSCLSVDYKRRPTAAYLLEMPKIKQWSNKLNISTDSNAIGLRKQVKQQIPIKKQSQVLNTSNLSKKVQQQSKSKSKSKQIQKQKIKLSKDGEKNVRQVLINKVPIDKSKKLSGAKRLQLKAKEQKQTKNPSNNQNGKNQIKVTSKDKKQWKNDNQKAYRSQMPSKKIQEPKQKQKPSITAANKFMPQKINQKREIDIQDKANVQKQQNLEVKNLSDKKKSVEINQKSQNRKLQLIKTAQQQLSEDQLAEQFGFAVSKLQQPNHAKKQANKKPISINWNEIQGSTIKKNKSIRQQQIPTIKVSTVGEFEQLKQMNIQQETEDNIQQQINQNRPYISDEQSEEQEEKQKQQLLIEDFDQKEQDLVKKMNENQKRKAELERMKKHYEPELLKLMPKNEYEKLKLKLIECKEDEVQQFVSSWKNNIQCINLFYRIIHFDIEIKRCQSNLDLIKQKLQCIKKQKI